MAYGYRTENERVNNVVDFNAMKDNTMYGDSSMLHFPKWKADVPNKWVSLVNLWLQKKPFNSAATNFGLYKERAAWNVKPLRLPGSKSDDYKYIEGLQKLGDDITSKQRIKSKEVNKHQEFIPYTREDVWKSTLHIS